MKDRPQPFEGHLDRLVQWSFGIDAMHDVNGVSHHAILCYRAATGLATDRAGTPTTIVSCWHIRNDNRSRPDNAGVADLDALDNAGPSSDMRSLSDVDITGQGDTGRNVRVSVDRAIMVDSRSRVDDHIRPQYNARLHDRPRHDFDTIFNMYFGSDDGGWVDHSLKNILLLAEFFVGYPARNRGIDRTHTIYQPHLVWRMNERPRRHHQDA